MWCQRLLKKHLQCDPFTLRQMTSFLFVVHDSGSELVATRLSVEFPPLHEELPDWAFFRHLYDHNILAYRPGQLEQIELNSEVAERLCALILFEAGEDLEATLSALEVRVHRPTERDSWRDFLCWRPDEEAIL